MMTIPEEESNHLLISDDPQPQTQAKDYENSDIEDFLTSRGTQEPAENQIISISVSYTHLTLPTTSRV